MADRSFSWFLALIRVLMGAFFLMEAEHQLVSGWIGGDDLAIKIQKAIDDTAIPPYDYFLDYVALQVDDPLTILVIIGEICIGVPLVLGLFTRLTAAVALFMNANFFLMNGLTGAGAVDVAFVIGEALLLAFASRQALSADAFLAKQGISGRLMSGEITRGRT